MMIPMMVPELLDEVFFVQEVDFFGGGNAMQHINVASVVGRRGESMI